MGWLKKTWKKAKNAVEKGAKSIGKTIASPFEAAYHLGESGVKLLEGDLSGASEAFGKATGDITRGVVGTTGLGLISPELTDLASGVGRAAGNLMVGNVNQAVHSLYDRTGIDLGAIEAKRAERAAQAEYQKQVDEANAQAEKNRRANLLNLRKSLSPSLSRSSQGGGSSNATELNVGAGGIVLG